MTRGHADAASGGGDETHGEEHERFPAAAAEADEEISSLGTALLEALREAGQDPESLR